MSSGYYSATRSTCATVTTLAVLALTVWAADPQRISSSGVEFVARWEGFRDRPYNCPAGHATIGYGHVLHRGPVTAPERRRWNDRPMTPEAARSLLRRDLTRAEHAVRRLVRVPLAQHEYDALVSWTHNVGIGALETSTLLRRLNAGDRAAVPGELARWVRAGGRRLPGLVARRREEARLFLGK